MHKHFDLMARVMKNCPGSSNGWVHKPTLVALLAHEIKKKEPHFNIAKFTEACGVEPISLEEARRPRNEGGPV